MYRRISRTKQIKEARGLMDDEFKITAGDRELCITGLPC